MRGTLWALLVLALSVPVVAAAFSPYLAYRQPVYIAAGFAGILAMALMPLQPLAAARLLPGLGDQAARRMHRTLGIALLALVALHVAGLWLTSPPDVVDALLLRSPTPFSAWGVLALWALVAAALVALLRARLRLPWRVWRRWHGGLTALAVAGTVAHALLIEGTMEPVSKAALSLLALLVTAKAFADLRIWARRGRPRT